MNISEVPSEMSILDLYERTDPTNAPESTVSGAEGVDFDREEWLEGNQRMHALQRRASDLRGQALLFASILTVEHPGKECPDDVHAIIKTMLKVASELECRLDARQFHMREQSTSLTETVERCEKEFQKARDLYIILTLAKLARPVDYPRPWYTTPTAYVGFLILISLFAGAIALWLARTDLF